MKPRKQVSKRRWLARIRAGRWVPSMIVYVLEDSQYVGDRYEVHPTERGFLRLRNDAEDLRRPHF